MRTASSLSRCCIRSTSARSIPCHMQTSLCGYFFPPVSSYQGRAGSFPPRLALPAAAANSKVPSSSRRSQAFPLLEGPNLMLRSESSLMQHGRSAAFWSIPSMYLSLQWCGAGRGHINAYVINQCPGTTVFINRLPFHVGPSE